MICNNATLWGCCTLWRPQLSHASSGYRLNTFRKRLNSTVWQLTMCVCAYVNVVDIRVAGDPFIPSCGEELLLHVVVHYTSDLYVARGHHVFEALPTEVVPHL